MKNILRFGPVSTTIAAIGIFFLLILVFVVWKPHAGQQHVRTIDGDGKGYYMYLPSIFISGDFGHEDSDFRYLLETPDGIMNRYNAGTSLLMAPFFGATCLYYELRSKPYDGYGTGFQKMISLATLFYLLLGLFAFSRLLYRFQFNTKIVTALLIIVATGTNLMLYTLSAPAFSHVYSFFAVAWLLLFVKRFMDTLSLQYLFLAAVFLGLTLLIRPFNGLIVFAFPFLARSGAVFSKALKKVFRHPVYLLLCVAIVAGISAIQQVLWFIQTGKLIWFGYNNEGFYFAHPQIFKVLFSFRKGLFIYTPALSLSALGLVTLYSRNRYRFYTYILFAAIITYFISSWWIWYYGPSFGHRVFIDFYPILFIPLAFFLQAPVKPFFKYLIIIVASGCIFLNLIQSYQYHNNLMAHSDMNFNKYKYILGKTDLKYKNVLGGASDMKPFHHKEIVKFQAETTFDIQNSPFKFSKTVYDSISNSMVADYSSMEYNVLAEVVLDSSYLNGREAFVELTMDFLELEATSPLDPVLLVFDLRDASGKPYYYVATPLKEVPDFRCKGWEKLKYSVVLPLRSEQDKLAIYIWNKPQSAFYADNLRFTISLFE